MKIVTLALAVALSIVLAGCGDEKKPDAKGAAPGATTAAAAKSAAPAAKPSSTAGGGW